VHARADQLLAHDVDEALVMRLSIEQELISRGLLQRIEGGWC